MTDSTTDTLHAPVSFPSILLTNPKGKPRDWYLRYAKPLWVSDSNATGTDYTLHVEERIQYIAARLAHHIFASILCVLNALVRFSC